ncbi:uncharacterized protein LOC144036554 isoform X2 [Vanacampus margaritifer]
MESVLTNSKNVSWLLGRDGDVAVIVIGEMDELTSKFICSGLAEKRVPSPKNNTVNQTILKSRLNADITAEREKLCSPTQPGISLNLKPKSEEASTLHPLAVSVSEHSSASPSANAQKEEKPASVTEEKPVSQPRFPKRSNAIVVRPATASVAPGPVNARPELANLKQASLAPSPSCKVDLQPRDHEKIEESRQGKGATTPEAPCRASSMKSVSSGSRVAQLMKTFSVDNGPNPPNAPLRAVKPALPVKPSHLRLATTSTVR